MYQVLYRKYRPKTFDDVCGQQVVVKLLKNSIKNNKISHAYLFAGPRGTGKTSMAKIFAKVVNCNNLVDLTPCDNCINCNNNSNDVIEIDAASNNGVDEIREIRNKVNLVPTSGKYKIYIIDEVHMLTTGAFNALLKTLEEPPAHVIFILATTDPHKIPETILSRCQRLDFKRIPVENIVLKLAEISKKENINVDDNVLKEIARLSDGGLRDSISLLDEASIFSEGQPSAEDIHMINGTVSKKEIIGFVSNLNKNNYSLVFECVENYNNCGKNFLKLTEEIIFCLKDILIYLIAPDYFKDNSEIECEIKNISREMSKEKLMKYIKEFNYCYSEMGKTNDYKLMFELSIINLLNIDEGVLGNISRQDENTLEKKKLLKTVENSKGEKKVFEEENSLLKDEKKQPEVNDKMLSYLRSIRIDNTLAHFDKKLLVNLKKQLENITGFLLEPSYSHFVSIIMDGTLKASSENNLIFVFSKKCISDDFNMNLVIIEELFEQLFGKHFDAISTWNDEWEIVKSDFNSKKKKYEYREEKFNLNELLMQKEIKNDLTNLFGDIIEYN